MARKQGAAADPDHVQIGLFCSRWTLTTKAQDKQDDRGSGLDGSHIVALSLRLAVLQGPPEHSV